MRSFWKALVCANLLMVAFAALAHAKSFSWSGNTDDDWGTPSNWFTLPMGGVPGVGDIAVFVNPSPNTTIELNGDRSIVSAGFDGGTDYTLKFSVSTDTLTLVTGDITAIGTATHTINSEVVLGANGDWDINNPLFRVLRNISGAFDLNKSGTGILELAATNTFSGTTNIDAGTIQLADANALQNSTVSINVNNGLDVTTNTIDATLGALDGTGNLNLGSQTLTTGGNGDSTEYSGVMSGTGSLTKTGAGTLTLTGANTYSGGTTFDGGRIRVSSDANLGANSGGLTFNGGELLFDSSFDLDPNRAITLNAGGGTIRTSNNNTTISQAITGTGGLTKNGTGTLTLTGANNYDGGTTIDGGTLSLGNNIAAGAGTITVLASTIDYADTVVVANTIDLQHDVTLNVDSGSATQSGIISETGGPFGVTKTGAGTLTVAGTNTYSGGTTIADGTLSISSDGNLGDVNGTVTFQGGTLRLVSPSFQAFVTDGADAVFEVADASVRLEGGISGDGSMVVNGVGGSALFLTTNTSTYSGSTTVNRQLGIVNNEMLPDGTDLIVNNAFSLHFGVTETIGSLSGAGAVGFTQGTGNLLIVGNNNADTVFSGVIFDQSGSDGGSGGLTKIGTGTLTLSGNSTYSEGTNVNGGTLLANNSSGSATGTGAVQVNSGGTLGGTGSVSGAVNVNSGGTLAPGASTGVLSVGSANFDPNSTFAVELAGTDNSDPNDLQFDQLLVTGNVMLDGSLDVSLVSLFTPSLGQSFEIVDVGGSLSGTFSGLSQGALVGDFGGTDLYINYAAGDGNDVALFATLAGDFDFDFDVDGFDFLLSQLDPSVGSLSNWEANYGMTAPLSAAAAVPEPGALALFGLGAILFSLRQRGLITGAA